MTARHSSAGAAHTQWCDHEMGEISSAASAFTDSASAGSPAASARRMPITATTATAADRASHPAEPP